MGLFCIYPQFICMNSNEVKTAMCNRILFYPTAINDTFDFNEAYRKEAERDLPSDDKAVHRFWATACNLDKKVLLFMINTGLIEKVNDSSYMLAPYGIGKRRSGGYFPIGDSFIDGNSNLEFKKFKKDLIELLEKEPTKSANISGFVNRVIDCKNNVKDDVRRYLVHLRRMGILEIKEDVENPGTDWWWGDFLGHNPQAGGEVTELYVALTKDYLTKPWKEKGANWVWIEIGKYVVGGVIGAAITIAAQKIQKTDGPSPNSDQSTQKPINSNLPVKSTKP